MKTKRILAVLTLMFILSSKASALCPPDTYTFVNPCQPFALINAVPNTYGCFSYSATNAGAPSPPGYYTWNFGDGILDTGTYVLHCYPPCTVSTAYTVTVSFNSPALCGLMPIDQSYTLMLNPVSSNSCVRSQPSFTLAPPSVTVWTGVVIPEMMYTLSYGDGSASTYLNEHTYANCGNYIITITDWDMNMPQYKCYTYLAVNIPCKTQTTTGISDYDRASVKLNLFPNPATDYLNINSEKTINGITIVDVLGRECLQESFINSSETRICTSGLQKGVYFIKVIYENASERTGKFVKE